MIRALYAALGVSVAVLSRDILNTWKAIQLDHERKERNQQAAQRRYDELIRARFELAWQEWARSLTYPGATTRLPRAEQQPELFTHLETGVGCIFLHRDLRPHTYQPLCRAAEQGRPVHVWVRKSSKVSLKGRDCSHA